MKLSIIVTYYNQEAFVRKSLDSILAQKLNCDYEILIGDDGSADGTVNIVNEYIQRYPDHIKLFTMPREKGVKYNPIHRASDNRLNLLSHATGQYFMILDGDDYYNSKAFIVQGISLLDQNKSLVACMYDFKIVSQNIEKLISQDLPKGMFNIKRFVRHNYIPAGAFIFRNVLDQTKINFLKNTKNFDDNLITIYMLQFGKAFYINEPLYMYVQSSESVWNSVADCEKNLLNAMDFEIISHVASKFRKQIARRQLAALNQTFKARNKLPKLLGRTLYIKYLQENKELKNYFIYNILRWNKLPIFSRLKIFYKFFYLKLIAKLS